MDTTSCGKRFLYLTKFINKQHVFAFIPARCKSWSCSSCRRIKARVVQSFIKKNFVDEPLWLLSLTYFHKDTPELAWKGIGKTVNRLLTYAHKMNGEFKYVRIVEPHADGSWPHVHILVNKPIATTSFVKLVTSWGFGWSFHSKQISCNAGAVYLSKYLSKEWPAGTADLLRTITKTRIVSASRCLGAIFKKESEWDCIRYDEPSEHTKFYYNSIVNYLKSKGALYIISKKCCSGFIIKSDIYVSIDQISNIDEPYIWIASDTYDYEWYPDGLQQDFLNDWGRES